MQVYTRLQRLLCFFFPQKDYAKLVLPPLRSRNKFEIKIINIKYKIVTALLFFLFFNLNAFASAPECPLYSTKRECLASVEENYRKFLNFIDEEYESPKDILIEAANDIKKYESFACQKTCLN